MDKNNPYVEIIEIKKNKTFIAKEGNIFEEEKTVVESAPVDEVEIDDLSENQSNDNKYRLSVGPFKNFNALKSTYISLNNLGFEDLNIHRE